MTDCHVCGNETINGVVRCPFCNARQEIGGKQSGMPYRQKTINLEAGRPFVETAITKLLKNVEIAQREGVSVLTVIHGYGSSGKGGEIRVEGRKQLDFLVEQGGIHSFVNGEDFNSRSGVVKMMLRRYPQLKKHTGLNRRNPGITIVFL